MTHCYRQSKLILTRVAQTAAAVISFILAMIHYPEVMRKAQAELDAVVGRERTPRFEDKENLPYIRAVIRETLRWRPPGPLGV